MKQNESGIYSRHIAFEKIGERGQKKLKKSKVTIVGLGGLGSPVSMYLAGAGVGNLRIVDSDRVSPSDIQRQILYSLKDVGKPKAEVAKKRLLSLNPGANIEAFGENLSKDNAGRLIQGSDIVMDCTDNLEAKFLLNRECFEKGMPFVHATVVQDMGWVSFIQPGETACLQCIIPKGAKPKAASQVGVLNSAPGVLGTIQATEAIKHLAGFGKLLKNSMLFVELSSNSYRKIKTRKQRGCSVCSNRR